MMKLFDDNRMIPGQDPWVVSLGGARHLLVQSCADREIVAFEFDGAKLKRRHRLWRPPRHSDHSRQLWAPELHDFGELGYVIYYTASDGHNHNHRIYALHSHNLLGPYREVGKVWDAHNDVWAIDQTVLSVEGKLYALWSGWEGPRDEFPQNLYIAPMSDPWTICGERQLLARPDLPWEMTEAKIIEGPQVWWRDDQLIILYAADASWSHAYKTGGLVWRGGSVLEASSWRKLPEPLLVGGGHGMVANVAGQSWLVHHRKTVAEPGWSDRVIHWTSTEELERPAIVPVPAAALAGMPPMTPLVQAA